MGLDDSRAECKEVETMEGEKQVFMGPREEDGRLCLPVEWEGR